MQVGTDTSAALLRNALESAGVDTDRLRSVPGPTGTAIILLQPTGLAAIIAPTGVWQGSVMASIVPNAMKPSLLLCP